MEAAADESKEATEEQVDEEKTQDDKEEPSEEAVTEESAEISTFQEGRIIVDTLNI